MWNMVDMLFHRLHSSIFWQTIRIANDNESCAVLNQSRGWNRAMPAASRGVCSNLKQSSLHCKWCRVSTTDQYHVPIRPICNSSTIRTSWWSTCLSLCAQAAVWQALNHYAYLDAVFLAERLYAEGNTFSPPCLKTRTAGPRISRL